MKIQQLISYKFHIFLGVPLLLFLTLQLLGFDGLYGQDSYEYLRYTKAIQNYMLTGEHPGAFYWPVLYPFIGSIFGFIFGSAAFGLHFLTCMSIGVICFYLYKILELLYPQKTSTSFYYILIFGLFSPYFLRAGLVVMSDTVSILFIVLTFYHFFKSHVKNAAFTYIFLFGTCALMARYATIMITLPIILFSIYLVLKRKAFKDIFIGGILSVLVCIPFIVLQWENLTSGTSNYFLNAWTVSHYFKTTYETVDGTQVYLFPNLVFVLYVLVHPGFIFLGSALAFFTLKKHTLLFSFPQKIIALSCVVYLLFLAGIPFQNIRVLTLIFPVVVLLFFPAFSTIIQLKWLRKQLYSLGIICILIQLTLSCYAFKTVFKRTLLEKEMATIAASYQGNTLYGFDYDIALEGRELDFIYKNMYEAIYTDVKKNELVLFNPTQLAQQWKGKNPMKNWNYINEHFELQILESFDNGWHLYQITTKK